MGLAVRAVGELDDARGADFRQSLGLPELAPGRERSCCRRAARKVGVVSAVGRGRRGRRPPRRARQGARWFVVGLLPRHRRRRRAGRGRARSWARTCWWPPTPPTSSSGGEQGSRAARCRWWRCRARAARCCAWTWPMAAKPGTLHPRSGRRRTAEQEASCTSGAWRCSTRRSTCPASTRSSRRSSSRSARSWWQRRAGAAGRAGGRRWARRNSLRACASCPWSPRLPSDPEAQAVVKAYDADVGKMNLEWAKAHGQDCPRPRRARRRSWATPPAPSATPRPSPSWEASKHHQAWKTLEDVGKQFHLNCVRLPRHRLAAARRRVPPGQGGRPRGRGLRELPRPGLAPRRGPVGRQHPRPAGPGRVRRLPQPRRTRPTSTSPPTCPRSWARATAPPRAEAPREGSGESSRQGHRLQHLWRFVPSGHPGRRWPARMLVRPSAKSSNTRCFSPPALLPPASRCPCRPPACSSWSLAPCPAAPRRPPACPRPRRRCARAAASEAEEPPPPRPSRRSPRRPPRWSEESASWRRCAPWRGPPWTPEPSPTPRCSSPCAAWGSPTRCACGCWTRSRSPPSARTRPVGELPLITDLSDLRRVAGAGPVRHPGGDAAAGGAVHPVLPGRRAASGSASGWPAPRATCR